MQAILYTKSGNQASTKVALDKDIFAQTPNQTLLNIAYNRYLNNLRQNNAVTLTRGLVRGGGKKPWRQKGTGRARTGSIRNPIWRGGGITFGPTGKENYQTNLSVKQIRVALAQALSAQVEIIRVIDLFKVDTAQTKKAVELISKITDQPKVLIVVDQLDATSDLAVRNLPDVDMVSVQQLTVFDVLNSDQIIIEKSALENISKWLGKTNSKGARK